MGLLVREREDRRITFPSNMHSRNLDRPGGSLVWVARTHGYILAAAYLLNMYAFLRRSRSLCTYDEHVTGLFVLAVY